MEKTRQIIEQDYYYMNQEMKQLGVQSNIKKKSNKLKDYIVPLESEEKLYEREQTYRESKSNEIDIKQDDIDFDAFNFSKVLDQRRLSLQVPELPKICENRRKFSLDSSNVPLSKHYFNNFKNDKTKNKNGLNNLVEENNLELKSLYSDSFLKSDLDLYQKPSQAYSARTQYSVRSNFTNPTTLSNLSNMTSNTFHRSSSYLPSSSTRLPKIKKNDEEKKRQVSFGKVELNQLDIPTLYRHSNVAMEKFKLDPYFYLPNGNLKRKFSLPKLDETLEAIKNCRYIRKPPSEIDENIDVTNIFKDIFQNRILSENIDSSFINEDDII